MPAEELKSTLEQTWQSAQQGIVELAPRLFFAILILLLGWLLARLARSLFGRSAAALRRGLRHLLQRQGAEQNYLPDAVMRVVGTIIFWLVLLLAVALASEVMGFAIITAWLSALVNYVPTLFAGILVIATGLLIARLSRDLIVSSMWAADSGHRLLVARLAYGIVATVTVMLGLDQLGVRVQFLAIMLAIVIGSFVGGLLLAFALGAQDFVRDLIAAQQLRKLYRAGQHIRVSDYEGQVLTITQVAVLLQTAEGQVSIPARRLLDEPVIRLDARDD